MLLAVYGTLKKGYGNHGYLQTSKYLGTTIIPGIMWVNKWEGYPRVQTIIDQNNIDATNRVTVELYDVTAHVLYMTCRLEVGAGYAPQPINIPDYGPAIIWASVEGPNDDSKIIDNGIYGDIDGY